MNPNLTADAQDTFLYIDSRGAALTVVPTQDGVVVGVTDGEQATVVLVSPSKLPDLARFLNRLVASKKLEAGKVK